MSPEIAAVERKGGYNQQCDIWSLGITSIELAELQPPLFDLHPMRALYLLSKSSYKPPQLKDRIKWSLDYHSFVKLALTKNPKKRPAADKLLDHTFVRQANLGHALGRDLIDQARNPRRGPGSDIGSVSEQDAEEDGGISHLKRIPSKKPTDDKSQNGDKGSPNFPSVLARYISLGYPFLDLTADLCTTRPNPAFGPGRISFPYPTFASGSDMGSSGRVFDVCPKPTDNLEDLFCQIQVISTIPSEYSKIEMNFPSQAYFTSPKIYMALLLSTS